MRIVLHIGAPKTGSSALQAAFVANRDLLRNKGVYYPQCRTDAAALRGESISGNAVALAKYLNPNVPLPDKEYDLSTLGDTVSLADAEGCSTVLYSSEVMNFFDPDRMAAFVRAAPCPVEIVYFVRNIPDHALSTYHQHVRKGRVDGPFEDYAMRQYRPKFSRVIERAIEAVGRENFTALSYDELRDSLFPAMLGAIGIDASSLPNAVEINASSDTKQFSLAGRTSLLKRWADEIDRVNTLAGRNILKSD